MARQHPNTQERAKRGSATDARSTGALAAMLKLYLQQWRPNPPRLLFVNQRGNPFTGENVIRDRLAPLLGELGLPRAGFHAFRHAHASLLLEAGATPAVTQAQMRYSDPRITLGIYGHVLGDAQRAAAEKVAEVLRPKVSARARRKVLRPIAPKSVKQGRVDSITSGGSVWESN